MSSELRKVVKRTLIEDPYGGASLQIEDELECGHRLRKPVGNKGSYHDYNPALRRRCDECAAGT